MDSGAFGLTVKDILPLVKMVHKLVGCRRRDSVRPGEWRSRCVGQYRRAGAERSERAAGRALRVEGRNGIRLCEAQNCQCQHHRVPVPDGAAGGWSPCLRQAHVRLHADLPVRLSGRRTTMPSGDAPDAKNMNLHKSLKNVI